MTVDRKTVAIVIVCLVAGYWLAGQRPAPPSHDRPVLRWVARAARGLLWLSLAAEQPPEAEPTYIVHSTIGPDGAPTINHARGW